ncbi:hypothetical protein CASFOL_005024 [Castilleja foliolosa]|uniref:Uncharacterized protein n=1 Tax=Castilleja foliolosa TaxID=1961234 RepID=A0ABD3E2C2_9LAMI
MPCSGRFGESRCPEFCLATEVVLSAPNARDLVINGAVGKGERLIAPAVLELLLRLTFPTSSARVKATERLEVVCTTVKDVALAGSPGSTTIEQVSPKIQTVAVKKDLL